ncbi:MAG: ankyrin repeat domain-containing protein [Simkaniaceae bacterium]|nr:ankyrin repeat domain-containing protein [Simkaniaceae bacterium]
MATTVFNPLEALEAIKARGLVEHKLAARCTLEAVWKGKLEGKPVEPYSTAERTYKWTPAHVAVVAKNFTALNALKAAGASLNARDFLDLTPMDYALALRDDEAIAILQRNETAPHTLTEAAYRAAIRDLLQERIPYESPIDIVGAPDDFAKSLEHGILVTKANDFGNETFDGWKELGKRFLHTTYGIKEVARCAGFPCTETRGQITVRDPLIHDRYGDLLITTSRASTKFEKCLGHAVARSVLGAHGKLLLLENEIWRGAIGAAKSSTTAATAETLQIVRTNSQPFIHAYLEGGDCFTVINRLGQQLTLISEAMFDMTQDICEIDPCGALYPTSKMAQALPTMKDVWVEPPIEISEEELLATARKLYQMGRFKIDGMKGQINQFQTSVLSTCIQASPLSEGETPFDRAVELGYVAAVTPEKALLAKKQVRKFLGHRGTIKNIIRDVLNTHAIVEIPSPFYHQDMWTFPGPHSTMFYADPHAALDILQKINPDAFGLSTRDKAQLMRFREKTAQVAELLTPFIAKYQAIASVGLQPVPFPGIFYGPEGQTLNFMNVVTGKAPDGRQIMITFGQDSGDRFGKLLMDIFAEQAKRQFEDIDVYFVGEDPAAPGTYPETKGWANELGAHCMTKELMKPQVRKSAAGAGARASK